MFPTTIDNSYQPKNKRRPRNDPNNRDYICPCGKSYLSYPALFTHIKTKHNGRAPGQIIKPRSQNSGRRGRPRQVCDSQSQTEDIAANALDRMCDFIMDLDKNQQVDLKQIYTKDSFYEAYLTFNQQEQQTKYIENQDLFQQTCDNVFCEFLAQSNKRINQQFYVDINFTFIVMLAKALNQHHKNQNHVKEESIRNIADFANIFYSDYYPKYVEKYGIQTVGLFKSENMAKMLELFYGWLSLKKYLNFKVKVNEQFFKNT